MKYCPKCGSELTDAFIDETNVKECRKCSFIDWNNWVFVACVVAAFNDQNEFLMVKLKGKEAGKITFPGGFRNLGETPEEAAMREFYEETGMRAKDLELFKIYTKDEQRLVWVAYKAKLEEVNFIENDEVGEILFVGEENLINKEHFRGKLTEKLFNDLLKHKK